MPAAQFAYRKGLGCTDALLTISHHLQKSLDTEMESHIVQLNFSTTFDRVSNSGLSFKLKYIGVGGSVLSICTEFLSDRRKRYVVNGAASEWVPIIAGMPQGCVLGPLLFILHTSEMFELVENRLFPHADDSTLLAVVRKPAYRRAVAAYIYLYRDLDRIHEWFNPWCMILNRNKTKALVVSRSWTVSHPHGDYVVSGVSIRASSNLDILGVKFDSRLTFEDHVRGIVSRVSQIIGILRLVKRIFLDTSLSLRCYFAFVLPILKYCSPVWGSAAECHLQLLQRQVYLVARLCPVQSFLLLCHRRRVSGLGMMYKVNSNSNHFLFGELPSASTRVRHT